MSTTHAPELTERLTRFLRDYYREEIAQLAEQYPSERRSLRIDWNDLYQFDPDVADDIVEDPEAIIAYLEEAMPNVDLPIDVDLSDANARVYNLPQQLDVPEVHRKQNIGRLVDVRAQFSKRSMVKQRPREAVFECRRCGEETRIPQAGDYLQEPYECQGCERQGPFTLNRQATTWIDHQYARIQQPPERTQGGNAEEIDVHLQGDLINELTPGDRVSMTSIYALQEPEQRGSLDYEGILEGHAVTKEESSYEDINVAEYREEIEAIAAGERGDPFELLVGSINPDHHGDEDVKLAIGLQLFGGYTRESPSGSRKRGVSHILMMGDPGCGKSTFLQAVDELAPRSTYASGKGATASGLTAAAVQDDFGEGQQWTLEAGALVLADGGVACIDELDKVPESAVSSMHDALESMRVHVNKAGINATLSAETSMLAAGNPEHGRFDPYQPRAEQLEIPPTLMSRFDLMFMVSDSVDEEQDGAVIDHMMRSRLAASKRDKGEPLSEEEQAQVEPAITPEVLRAYIAHARESCKPDLRDEAARELLREEFMQLRLSNQEDEESPIPVTYRQVEAIERLAEASARVRLSDRVEVEDVERALMLVKKSMRQVGIDPETGQFDADIIETGESLSQRERRKRVLAVIADKDGTSIEEIAEVTGIDEGYVKSDLEHYKERGEIYGDPGELRKA
jgi:replicative DNA helicase Mcm